KEITSASVILSHNGGLTAFIVTRAAATPSYNELVTQLKQLLPQYIMPTKFAVVSSIPTTAGGKVDRAALLKQESASVFLTYTQKSDVPNIIKPTVSYPSPRKSQKLDDVAAGIVSMGVAVPSKKFRADKLSELVDFLKYCSFPLEYIEHIRNTGKCPGTLLSND